MKRRRIWLAATLVLPGVLPARAGDPPLPPDVAHFIEQREICDHFRGEPFDNDPPRRAFVVARMHKFCRGTDRALARMKRKYSGNTAITARLAEFEDCVEARSHCQSGGTR